MKALTDTYAERLNRIPPFLCFAMAKDGRHKLSIRDVSKRSGLTIYTVRMMVRSKSWDRFPIADIDRFRAACGITLRKESRTMADLRRMRGSIALGGGLVHLASAHHRTKSLVTEAMRSAAAELAARRVASA